MKGFEFDYVKFAKEFVDKKTKIFNYKDNEAAAGLLVLLPEIRSHRVSVGKETHKSRNEFAKAFAFAAHMLEESFPIGLTAFESVAVLKILTPGYTELLSLRAKYGNKVRIKKIIDKLSPTIDWLERNERLLIETTTIGLKCDNQYAPWGRL